MGDGRLGRRIAGTREIAGLSQAELARRIGVSRSAVAQWEREFTEPSAGHLRRLAEVARCSYDWLANGIGPRELPDGGGPMTDEGERIDANNSLPDAFRPVLALLGPGRELWQLTSDRIAGAGYRRGDYLVVDVTKKPQAGNFVLAEQAGKAIFRQYFPPHLFTVAFGPQSPHITIDNSNIKINGVIIARYSI